MKIHYLIPLILFSILISCKKNEPDVTEVILECKGKTIVKDNYYDGTFQTSPKIDTNKIIKLVSRIGTDGKKIWLLNVDGVYKEIGEGNDPNQKNHPWWKYTTFVTDDQISYYSLTGINFSKKIDFNDINDKNINSIGSISINRINGLWSEKFVSFTEIEKFESLVDGKCEKIVHKF